MAEAGQDLSRASKSVEEDARTDKKKKKKSRFGIQNLVRRRLFRLTGKESKEGGDTSLSIESSPKHLVIMVNGIIGSAKNWRFAQKQFLKRRKEDVLVHCSKCNVDLLTLDGIDVMGKRLAHEVLFIVKQRPELSKISFVGHSLGGLIARYAIAELFEPSSEQEGSERGKIAGLEPVNFVTFATPHLGSRWHKQVPVFCGVKIFEKAARQSSWILGRTGRQLFLEDGNSIRPPLLSQMVTDSKDLPFISALRSFHRRVAYSNARFDHIVGWNTSSIRHQHDLPKIQTNKLPGKINGYRHIVRVELPKAINLEKDTTFDTSQNSKNMQEIMIDSLNKVPWERVDVSFHRTLQRLAAHETIQVKIRRLHSAGADVITHLIDNFLT